MKSLLPLFLFVFSIQLNFIVLYCFIYFKSELNLFFIYDIMYVSRKLAYTKKDTLDCDESDVIPYLGSSEINYVEIRCFFYLKNIIYKSINIIINRRSITKNRDFSLLVTIPPPFFIEGKTSDIFKRIYINYTKHIFIYQQSILILKQFVN